MATRKTCAWLGVQKKEWAQNRRLPGQVLAHSKRKFNYALSIYEYFRSLSSPNLLVPREFA